VAIDFDVTGERIQRNDLINEIRSDVDLWRGRGYPGVTPYTRKLLEHWAGGPSTRDDPVFFCQREAVETAIFLAESAGRSGQRDRRPIIDRENEAHNDGLARVALKMATGSGKTVVMAMLIAWQTINKVNLRRDNRFTNRFLVVTPGITIRDRLRVLQPSDPLNYYRERDLVPADLWGALDQARIVITNYHTFLHREVREAQGVSRKTKNILTAGKTTNPFVETDDQMVNRVLRGLNGTGAVVVLSDEAHHCYRDRPVVNPDDLAVADRDDEKRNEDARVWFRGIQAVRRKVGVKAAYDLSATPYYLKGSGYNEGFIFPWTVSDFSLMDAIESGIVKVPRVPVDDDAAGDQVTYLHLWEHVGDQLPKKKGKSFPDPGTWVPPEELEGALRSLYRSYERSFRHYEAELEPLGEPPPVMIVVCPNTMVSKLVYDWVAGVEIEAPDGTMVLKPGELPLLSNVLDGRWMGRPHTLVIDSAQLESGEVLKPDFRDAARAEIETFKAEKKRRQPGLDVDSLDDSDLLREVMNTVGRPGTLGERVRCVVSVSMLTEGWDANTVSHILGIRRFGSQLLCEQVVGRGLRRRSYAIDENGRLSPEYAEVYGVPFAFIPGDKQVGDPSPKSPAVMVQSMPDRWRLRIDFPKLDGYRFEIPDETLFAEFADEEAGLHVDRDLVATWTQTRGVVGEADEHDLDDIRDARPQAVAFVVARVLLQRHFAVHDGAERPWLFPQLVDITRRWLASGRVTFADDTTVGMLLLAEGSHRAAEAVFRAIRFVKDDRVETLLPILRRFDPDGSTEEVCFPTRKVVIPALKSHVSHVVLDGVRGNTWEEEVAGLLEDHAGVAAYVKNDHLGFEIPYVHEGRTHRYLPDFLVRLTDEDGEPDRTLVVEVSGGRKDAALTKAKADTARLQWCPAVNHHGGWGRWGYIEITDMAGAGDVLDSAIESLRAGGPVTGQADFI
jgi:type III restriction enzyme